MRVCTPNVLNLPWVHESDLAPNFVEYPLKQQCLGSWHPHAFDRSCPKAPVDLVDFEPQPVSLPTARNCLPASGTYDGDLVWTVHKGRDLNHARGAGDPGRTGHRSSQRSLEDRQASARVMEQGGHVFIYPRAPDVRLGFDPVRRPEYEGAQLDGVDTEI
jgi:hypothetical protein